MKDIIKTEMFLDGQAVALLHFHLKIRKNRENSKLMFGRITLPQWSDLLKIKTSYF